MQIESYFTGDDGSLPEIEIKFSESSKVANAFTFLFSHGAKNVTVGGCSIWLKTKKSKHRFSDPQDFDLVISGAAEPFHIVLGGIVFCEVTLPDIGVWADLGGLTLDYRMGFEWGHTQISAFIELLREFKKMGASIAVPWWGSEGELVFLQAIASV